jgi:hypothetical protein
MKIPTKVSGNIAAASIALLVALFGVAGAPLGAQQEAPVSLDKEGRVMAVDRQLASRLGLFVDRFPGFREARLFVQLPDSAYILEVTVVRDGQTLRERVPMSDAEARELQDEVSRRISLQAPALGLDQEGRARLLGGTTLMGLAFYGWAVPVILDIDEGTTAAGLYMLTAGTSFLGPWLATRQRAVSRGMTDLGMYGATRGALHGFLVHYLATWKEDDDLDSSGDGRGEVAAAMGFSVAEGLGGYLWAGGRGLELATTRTLGLGGDFGMIQGLSLAGILDPGDRATAALALLGGWGGVGLGHAWAGRRDHSSGDVTALGTAGHVGLLTGLALADLMDAGSHDRWYGVGALAGSLSGLAVGDRLVRTTHFTEAQGRLVALGSVAGGAFGLGVAYLIVGDDDTDDDRSSVYLASTSVGAMAGYGLTYRSLAPRAPSSSVQPQGLELSLHPVGLAGAYASFQGGGSRGQGVPLPLVSGRYRF